MSVIDLFPAKHHFSVVVLLTNLFMRLGSSDEVRGGVVLPDLTGGGQENSPFDSNLNGIVCPASQPASTVEIRNLTNQDGSRRPANFESDDAKGRYLTLERFVLPPTGTAKSEVDKVFGTPTRFPTPGRNPENPEPRYSYGRGPSDEGGTFLLDVEYREEKVVLAQLHEYGSRTPAVATEKMAPSQDGDWEYWEDKGKRLRERIARFEEALLQPDWNRRRFWVQGSDLLEFPPNFMIPTEREQEALANKWYRTFPLGEQDNDQLPFRVNVRFGSTDSSHTYVERDGKEIMVPACKRPDILFRHDTRVYCPVAWDSIGYFLAGIHSEKQFVMVVSLLEPGWSQRLTATQYCRVLKEINSLPTALPLRILKHQIDDESLFGKCVERSGTWLTGFAVIEDASVIEYKYAINPENRVARLRRVLVRGPKQPDDPMELESDSPPRFKVSEDLRARLDQFDRCHGVVARAAYLPELKEALEAKDPADRITACRRIGEIGAEAKDAVPELRKVLFDSDKNVRRAAAYALRSIGPAATEAFPDLRKALGDKEPKVRDAVADAMLRIGTIEMRVEATKILGDMGRQAGDARLALAYARNDENQEVCQAAKAASKKIEEAWAPSWKTVPEGNAAALRKDLTHREARVRWRAAYALGQMGAAAKDAVPDLRKLLVDPEAGPYGPMKALGKIGPPAAEAVPDLRKFLTGPDEGLRCDAARALGGIGPDAKAAVPELVRLLNDQSTRAQEDAAWALGKIGDAARPAIPQLKECLIDPCPGVRFAAAAAIDRIQPQAESEVKKALEDRNLRVRERAIDSLIERGDIVQVRASLTASSADLRLAASLAVGRRAKWVSHEQRELLGSLLPELRKAVNDADERIRHAASEAVDQLEKSRTPFERK